MLDLFCLFLLTDRRALQITSRLSQALAVFAIASTTGCEPSSVIRASSLSGGSDGTLGVATISAGTLSTGALDFGDSDCGGEAPASQSVTVKNDGEGALRWKASINDATHFDLAGVRAGTLEPGQTATLTVSALPMPSDAVAGAVQSATVLITTDDPAKPEVFVPVKATARGATLELIAPASADFGEIPLGVAAPTIPVTIRNTGNVPAKVSVAAPGNPQFSFTWDGAPTAAEVAPGATMTGLVAGFVPTTTNVSASAGLVTVEGPVCGKSVSALNVKGRGLGGLVGVSPGTVDIGKVSCGTQGEPRVLTVYNSGNLVFTWTAALKDGTNFTLSQSGGAVVPGGASQITVTPKPLGKTTNLADDAFGDTLTITTDVPGDMPHEVPIKQTATGAILNWNATPVDFGKQPVLVASAPKLIVVTNSGTQAAKVRVSGGTMFASSEGLVPANGGAFVASVSFTPDGFGLRKGTFSLVTEDPICADVPAAVSASGTGRGSAAALAVGGPQRRNSHGQNGGCILLANSGGRVACFGNNDQGQLGTTSGGTGPVIVEALKDIVQLSSGGDYNCAVAKDGRVFCWGNNRNGRGLRVGKLGVTNVDTSSTPVEVPGITTAVEVGAGHNMTCARLMDGTVWCWGSNRRGKLGTGSESDHNVAPVPVNGVANAVGLAIGSGGGCARINDNTVRCWGRYGRGNLGTSGGPGQVQVQNMTNAIGVAAMTGYARNGARCALRMTGEVACWGSPRRGQLGHGSDFRGDVQDPQTVSLPGMATSIAGYAFGGCALMADKTVYCWGRNENGQVGNGTNNQQTIPVAVTGLNDASAIAAGGMAACAIVTGGSVRCWGNYGAGSSNLPQNLNHF
jgi:alpha-tubulin suppressor-like RCC1 family protein